MQKIIVVGSNGSIGSAVTKLLSPDYDLISVGYSAGDYRVDLNSKESITSMYEQIGRFDALISVAGVSSFATLQEASDEDFTGSLMNKLMGQVNLVRVGINHINDNGSFTLTGGMLGQTPWPGTVPTATVNAGLEGFTRAAALDVDRNIRVNLVNPVLVTETAQLRGIDTSNTISAAKTALAYKASVEGNQTGQVLDVRSF